MTDEITVRLAFALFGLVVGMVLGWSSRAARDASAVRKGLMEKESAKRRRWPLKRTDAMLLVLIAIALASNVTTWYVNTRVDRVSECTANVTERLVTAVNERTTYAVVATRANGDLQAAQRKMLTEVGPDSPIAERKAALTKYIQSLDAFQAAQRESAQARQENPYPTADEIRRCR